MRILVDVGSCCGHARCAEAAPDLFVLNDIGYLDTPEIAVSEDQEAIARRGAGACPEGCITIEEAEA